MAGSKHGPNRITNYLETHDTVMGQFVDAGFVLSDTLELVPVGVGLLVMHGRLSCLGGIALEVYKLLKVVDGEGASARVETIDYVYNAHLQGVGNILRYDCPHPDHNCFHHVHKFDVFNGDREGTVERIDGESRPTLGEVVGELQAWFYENYARLDRT